MPFSITDPLKFIQNIFKTILPTKSCHPGVLKQKLSFPVHRFHSIPTKTKFSIEEMVLHVQFIKTF